MPEASSKQEYLVGLDLGGTKILAGLFNPQLKCLARSKMTTKAFRGTDSVIERMARTVQDVIDECDLTLKQIKGVGVGAPGSIDRETGKVLFAPNLGWKDVSLRKELEKQLGLPVYVDNDCSLCTLGIFEAELKGKPSEMAGVFLGTGIGGGLIINGKPYHGFTQTSGEVGHMVLDIDGPKCNCGNLGCFEALASRTAIFRDIQAAVKQGQKTVLTEMLGPELENLRSGDLRKALKRGDKLVEKIIEDAAMYTGIAVANLINVFNPEVVVIGGGIMEQLEESMMPVIVETALDYAMHGSTKGVEIIASKLGDDAGITGGAVLVSMEKG